jgi:hypothetical protein
MGNCLDRALSSSNSSLDELDDNNLNIENEQHDLSGSLRRRNRTASSNRYIHLNESIASIDRLSNNTTTNNNNLNPNLSLNNFFSNNSMHSQNSNSQQQVFYLSPSQQRTADQLTEEEQIKLLKRMTLVQQLPTGSFDQNKKHKE